MLKTIIVAVIAGLPLLFSAGEVRANNRLTGVTCPAGTCGANGANNAKDIKFCKASKCPKGVAK
jgi:hypothetical protein